MTHDGGRMQLVNGHAAGGESEAPASPPIIGVTHKHPRARPARLGAVGRSTGGSMIQFAILSFFILFFPPVSSNEIFFPLEQFCFNETLFRLNGKIRFN